MQMNLEMISQVELRYSQRRNQAVANSDVLIDMKHVYLYICRSK